MPPCLALIHRPWRGLAFPMFARCLQARPPPPPPPPHTLLQCYRGSPVHTNTLHQTAIMHHIKITAQAVAG